MALITHRIHCQVLYFDDKNNVAKLNTLEAHVDVKTTQFGFVKQAIILQLCVFAGLHRRLRSRGCHPHGVWYMTIFGYINKTQILHEFDVCNIIVGVSENPLSAMVGPVVR